MKQDDTGFYLAKFERGNELNSLNLWLMPEFRSVARSFSDEWAFVCQQTGLITFAGASFGLFTLWDGCHFQEDLVILPIVFLERGS